jgi:hypothetical protein
MKAARLLVFALVVSAIALQAQSVTTQVSPSHPSTTRTNQVSCARLPLIFEQNQGQTDSQARFLSRCQGYALFLTPTEAVLKMATPRSNAPEANVLRMKLLGTDSAAMIGGVDPQSGYSNYCRFRQ